MTARGWDRSGLAPRWPCNLSVNLKVLKTKTVCLKYDTSKRFKRGLKSAKITLSSGRVRAGALRCGPRLYRGHFASARDAPERQGAAEVAGPRGRGAEPGEGRQRPRALWRLRGRSAAPGASRGWCPRALDPAARPRRPRPRIPKHLFLLCFSPLHLLLSECACSLPPLGRIFTRTWIFVCLVDC